MAYLLTETSLQKTTSVTVTAWMHRAKAQRLALGPSGSNAATLPGPSGAGTVQGQHHEPATPSCRLLPPCGALPLPLRCPGTPQVASFDPGQGIFFPSRRGPETPGTQETASQPSFPWLWRAQEAAVPGPGQDYTVGSAAVSLPAVWELPLLSRSNLGIDLSEQSIEKGTPVPSRETHTVVGPLGPFLSRKVGDICATACVQFQAWGGEGGPSWQGRSAL